jgi:hypothetical protein
MKDKINIWLVAILGTFIFCCTGCEPKSSHKFNINIYVANTVELKQEKPLPKVLQQISNYIELDEETVYFPVVTISRLDTTIEDQVLDVPLSSLNDFRKSINLLSPLNLMNDFDENISKMTVPGILSLTTNSLFDSNSIAANHPDAIWINLNDTSTLFLRSITSLLKTSKDNIDVILYRPHSSFEKKPIEHLKNPTIKKTRSSGNSTTLRVSTSNSVESVPCEFDIITFDLNNGEISCITDSKSNALKYVLYIATDRFFNNSNIVLTQPLNNNRFGKTASDQNKLKSIQQYANLYAKIYVTCEGVGKYTNAIGPLSNSCISSGDCILMYRKLNQ